MLDAYKAVQDRNKIMGDLLEPLDFEHYEIERPDPGDEIVITCTWQRAMSDETTVIDGSPGDLQLKLQRRPIEGGSWDTIYTSDLGPDNIEQVRSQQPGLGQQYDYRVRVKRMDSGTSSTTYQAFTLASRHAFAE